MVKVVEIFTRPALEEKRNRALICDLCGKTSPNSPDMSNVWSNGDHADFAVSEVTLEYRHGYNYGHDGGNYKTESYDICPDCWRSKLIPWMKSQGAALQIVESDF